MEPLLTDYITLPRKEFCRRTGLSETTVKKLIKDGRLKAIQLSERKQMVLVRSYVDLLRAAQERSGKVVDIEELLGMA